MDAPTTTVTLSRRNSDHWLPENLKDRISEAYFEACVHNPDADPIVVPMSRSEFDSTEWPEKLRVEWANGMVVVMPPVRHYHWKTQHNIANVLERALPDAVITGDVGLTMVPSKRAPDVMVIDGMDGDSAYYTGVPALVVEVLSPSTASNDLLEKAAEYAVAGIPHYWIINPQQQAIHLRRNVGRSWEMTSVVDALHPEATIDIVGHGKVTLRHTDVFR